MNVNVQCLDLQRIDPFLINIYNLSSYARDHSTCIIQHEIFMLLVSSFYTFSEILSSNVTAGIPVLPWWTGKFGTIIVRTINTRTKKKGKDYVWLTQKATINISFNLFFFSLSLSIFFQFYFHRMNRLLLIL